MILKIFLFVSPLIFGFIFIFIGNPRADGPDTKRVTRIADLPEALSKLCLDKAGKVAEENEPWEAKKVEHPAFYLKDEVSY